MTNGKSLCWLIPYALMMLTTDLFAQEVTGTVTDIDLNTYDVVQIGNQLWMVQNLETTRYRDGSEIPNVTDEQDWTEQTSDAWSKFEDNDLNYRLYGALYNWYAVTDPRGLCPQDWRVPGAEDWAELAEQLGGEVVAGGKMKETRIGYLYSWIEPNSEATNESGFSARPGGLRYSNGAYYFNRTNAFFWSSTEDDTDSEIALYRSLKNDSPELFSGSDAKNMGLSVRCMKNVNPDESSSVTDIDGNRYATVRIGERVWMAENLKTTRYRDSTLIPNEQGFTWLDTDQGAWVHYDNDASYEEIYGKLYNWLAVNDPKGLCPEGWYVPTYENWVSLLHAVGGEEGSHASKLKASGTGYWHSENNPDSPRATNESGFTALPGGYRDGGLALFRQMSTNAYFWSSSLKTSGSAWRLDVYDYREAALLEGKNTRDGYSVRCLQAIAPTLATSQASDVTSTTATLGGEVTSTGGAQVEGRGVVWSSSPDPTLESNEGSVADSVGGPGSFVIQLEELNPSTTYYARAYAMNSAGTSYGEQVSFTTMAAILYGEPVRDLDGNEYRTVWIGEQLWMAENLRTSRYADGTAIPNITNDASWAGLGTGAWAAYGNDSENEAVYGKLYNGFAVENPSGLCPLGWSVPTDAEWTVMTDVLGGGTVAGRKLKPAGPPYWLWPDSEATNESGFTALPGGLRNHGTGTFSTVGEIAVFWTSTQSNPGIAWLRFLSSNGSITRTGTNMKSGLSIRCVQKPLEVSDVQVGLITPTSATARARIVSDGGASVIRRGAVWSVTGDPSLTDNTGMAVDDSPGADGIVVKMSGLTPSTTYRLRAFAVNADSDTAYSVVTTFETGASAGSLLDVDGNEYPTVWIGEQLWMAENLRTSRYADGTEIPNVTENAQWSGLETGAWAHHGNDPANEAVYGKLYNGHAVVDQAGLCPEGWHVPADAEWVTLADHLGGDAVAGGKMKATGTSYWRSPNIGATNESGFTARGGGIRMDDVNPFVHPLGTLATFWSSTYYNIERLWFRTLFHDESTLLKGVEMLGPGKSVRCVRDSLSLRLSQVQVEDVAATSAVASSEVLDDGAWEVVRRGVVWNTTADPSLSEHLGVLDDGGTGRGEFNVKITGLEASTTYHVRAFAINANSDTAYSAPSTFFTRRIQKLLDVDGNEYSTVMIGEQIWMAENLRTSRYADGTEIPNVTSTPDWSTLTTGAWVHYFNNSSFESLYGKLYNGYAALNPRGLCPQGWHVPSDAEWSVLSDHLGGAPVAGGKMKITRYFWVSPNVGATNESGFTAVGSGFRSSTGSFERQGISTEFWSSSEVPDQGVWVRSIRANTAALVRGFLGESNGFSVRCLMDPLSLSQPVVGLVTPNSASVESQVLSDGGTEVARRGVVWGATSDVSLRDNMGMAEDGSPGVGTFTLELTGLTPSTSYHVRAFAVNEAGETAYGPSATFTTPEEVVLTDVDGNEYRTVWIGEQLWMAENLRTGHYADGTAIANVTDGGSWAGLSSGAWAHYGNDASNETPYGKLYNWYAVANPGGLCPQGWKVPGDADWSVLSDHLGGESVAGGKLKAQGEEYWRTPNTGATNQSGFTALPGGGRTMYGEFLYQGVNSGFWSSTPYDSFFSVWVRDMYYDGAALGRGYAHKRDGRHVRCLWDANRVQVVVDTPGPRLMSLPGSSSTSLGSFLEPLWTQGAVGADSEDGTPNVYTYDGSQWVGVGNLTGDAVQPGQGFVVSVYADTDFDGQEQGDLPVILSADGGGPVERVDRALVFQTDATQGSGGGDGGGGWNLVGNPFGIALDAQALGAGVAGGLNAGITSTVYVYDASSGWLVWNRESAGGSLRDGRIEPLHGFFVRATGAGASLALDPSMRVGQGAGQAGGNGAGKGVGGESGEQSGAGGNGDGQGAALTLRVLTGEGPSALRDQVMLSWSGRGRPWVESTDSYKLVPLSVGERLVARLVSHEADSQEGAGKDGAGKDGAGKEGGQTASHVTSLEIQNLPLALEEAVGEVRIPLEIQHLVPEGEGDSGVRYAVLASSVRLEWSARNREALEALGVQVTLVERATGRRVALAGGGVAESGGVDLELGASSPYSSGGGRVYAVDRQASYELVVSYGASAVGLEPGAGAGPEALPERFELRANYPNPFNPSTALTYALPEPTEVRLEVFDAAGRRVAVLADGMRPAGVHTATFEAGALASGVYIARFTAPGFMRSRAMVLLK